MRGPTVLVVLLAGWLAGCASTGPHASPSEGQRRLLEQTRSLRLAAVDFDQESLALIAAMAERMNTESRPTE